MAKKSMIAKSKRVAEVFDSPSQPLQLAVGVPMAYYRKFGLCRICLRELANRGELPGVTKASW